MISNPDSDSGKSNAPQVTLRFIPTESKTASHKKGYATFENIEDSDQPVPSDRIIIVNTPLSICERGRLLNII